MSLQSSGQISMNNIRVELGIPTQSPFSLETAENGDYVLLNQCSTNRPDPINPSSISEWYGYCHSCGCGTVNCDNQANNGTGGTGFYNYTITLGSSVGIVRFSFDARNVPDKFVVNYDGSTVIDTGFRGSSSYNTQLNQKGYPNVSGVGQGYVDFVKTTASPTTANVQVIAPLNGTLWFFTLGCPYYTYSLSYSDISCDDACSSLVTSTYYSTCSSLTRFCVLKTEPSISSSAPPVGFYSDGVNCYITTDAGLPGMIGTVSICPITIIPCIRGFDVFPYRLLKGYNNTFFVGGFYSQFDGNVQNKLVNLNEDGTKNESFNIGNGPNNNVRALCLGSNEKVYIAGELITTYNSSSTGHIIRLNSDGSIDNTFTSLIFGDQYASKWVLQMKELSNGKLLVIGDFAYYGANLATNTIIINSDGSFHLNLDTNSNGYSRCAIVQPDDKIVVGGLGGSVIERLSILGVKDTAFNTNHGTISGYLPDSETNNNYPDVYDLELQPDGRIIAVGSFTTVDGYSRNGIVRLLTDGTIDPDFDPGTGFNATPFSVLIQPDGKILVGGAFTSYNGTSCNRIVRLNWDGAIDTDFIIGTGFNYPVFDITFIGSKIYCVGSFTTYKGVDTAKNGDYIASLDTDGNLLECSDIAIDISVPSFMNDENNPYTFAAETSGQVDSVDTDVYVNINWFGDLGGTAYSSIIIYQGQSCNKDINVNFVPSIPSVLEYHSSTTTTISPSSFGTQNYISGTTILKGEFDSYPC